MSELIDGSFAPTAPGPLRRLRAFLRDVMVLTKFRINVVGVFTGLAALAIHEMQHPERPIGLLETLLCLLALLLVGGAANALNQIIERDRDRRMDRTADRRPLPSGRMSAWTASLIAAIQLLGAAAILIAVFDGWLALMLALFTIFYYAVFYTWYLKPRHYLNIVIGGVPGAMGPLIAWAAVSGTLAWEPVLLFLIIFLWTPPHFWALAIRLREDYARAGIPMLPVVKGIDETSRQIFLYTVIMVLATLLLPLISDGFRAGPLYAGAAALGGAIFLVWSWRIWRRRPMPNTMPLFHYSIVYIGILFTAVILDASIWGA